MADISEVDIPIYKSTHYSYILMRDMKVEYEKLELTRLMAGQTQPLIQGEGKGVREYQDAVFLEDYLRYLDYRAGKHPFISPLTD